MQRRTMTLAGAITLLITAWARTGVRRIEIAGHSMQPALQPGDWVLAVRRRRLRRGDVAVYPHPRNAEMELVKRLIGLSGERIVIEGGQVHADGRVLAEPWADGPSLPDGSWAVPAGHGFFLGDRRPRSSFDSRHTGPVPITDPRWQVVLRYWPLLRIGRIT